MTPLILAAALSCLSPHVADGDTLTCSGTHVRLFGINAPEIAHPGLHIAEEPGGQDARMAMRALVSGHTITCTPAGNQHDRYGRMVAICRDETGADLGQIMLREGHACVWKLYAGSYYDGQGRVCDRRGR